ncbi:Uncharacterised protein [Listeria newyorkensis]|nr:Uncharacterised protein [Listeria newyorkensis]
MKNLGHAITEQLSYQRKSRRLLWLLFGILVVCCLSSFNQYEAWKSPNEDLKATLASNKSIGYTLEQALAADQVITKVDGVESSDNPIKYFYYEAKTQKAALNPWNAPNQFFTSLAVVVLPVMWGLYCILTTLGTNKAGHEIRSYRSSFFWKTNRTLHRGHRSSHICNDSIDYCPVCGQRNAWYSRACASARPRSIADSNGVPMPCFHAIRELLFLPSNVDEIAKNQYSHTSNLHAPHPKSRRF